MGADSIVTICKFFENPKNTKKEKNGIISRTMAKIAVVDEDYDGEKPVDGEFWKVRILEEKGKKGSVNGCFLVEPLERVDEKDFRTLVPGMYTMQFEEGILYITPKTKENWILPLHDKRILAQEQKAYAIIVKL